MMNAKHWIKAPRDMGGAAVEFRRHFKTAKKVASATINVTAMGVYTLYLNGKRLLDNGVLTPGFTGYKNHIQYQTYDVTAALRAENDLTIAVAPGWAVGNMGYQHKVKNFCDEVAVIGEMTIRYADGTKSVINTGSTFDVYTSPVVYSDIYMGETIDLCHKPTYIGKAQHKEITSRLVPQVGELILEQERIAAAELIIAPNGERVIDFGQNMTGYVEFRVKGKRGEKIRISFGEVLDRDGNFYNANYRSSRNEVEYILDGKARVLKPEFSFQGFRYIRIDEYPNIDINLADITAIVVHSELRRTGTFVCGNERVNQLYRNTVWGQKSNYLDIPTDCPQRDERLGWTGDTQVFSRTAALNFDVRRFMDKWLLDMRAEQEADGAVHGVCPSPFLDGTYNTRGSAAWGDSACVVPWQMYMAYGDKKILSENFEMMKKWVGYMHGFGREEFLWLGGNHYGDWLAMDAGGDYYHGATSYDLIASAYFAYSTSLVIKAGEALGENVDEYRALYKNVCDAFRAYFTNDGVPKDEVEMTFQKPGTDYGDIFPNHPNTQTSLVLMLAFGLCRDEERPMLADMLCDLIEKNDGCMATGFVGTPLLLHALSENGKTEMAYKLLMQSKSPSWLYSVDHGATTIWEHWNSIKEDGSFWSTDMNSFNHYSYGAVCDWLYGVACGVTPTAPGYAAVRIAPQPSRVLGHAQCALDTPVGKIESAWYYRDDMLRIECATPAGVPTEIVLPDGTTKNVNGGKYVFTLKA